MRYTKEDRERALAGIPKYGYDPPDQDPEWRAAAERLKARKPVDVPESRNGAAYRLSLSEKRKLFMQTGQRFDDHAQYKAWCRATGKRDIERGEPQDVVRRDMDEWYQDTGGAGESPHSWKTAKGGRRREIDMPWRNGA